MPDLFTEWQKGQERELYALDAKRDSYYRDAEYKAREKILQEKDDASTQDNP